MRKVLFAYWPLKVKYNHGISLLAAILRRNGIEINVLSLTEFIDFGQILKALKPDFVGFGIVTSQEYNFSLPFMRKAKAMSFPVMVGGVYVRRGSYIDPSFADYICRGEGESLPEFILEGDSTVFEQKYVHENLDNLPLPEYGNLTGYEFDRDIPFLKGIRIIPYHSSRGCPHRCSFCEVQFQPRKLRMRTRMKEDMDFLWLKYRPEMFHIMDELLPYYRQDWRDLFDGNPYPFMSYIRPDIKENELDFLIANGLQACAFGIESGNETYRNEVLKKDVSDEQIFKTVRKLDHAGIQYIPFYMVRTPFETEKIRQETLTMARNLGGYPAIWRYEDLSKRVFSIDDQEIRQYSEKTGADENLVRSNLNDTTNYVISESGDLMIYQILDDSLFIKDLIGKGKSLEPIIHRICEESGVERYFGNMQRVPERFIEHYGLKYYGHLVGKEVPKWE